VGPPLFFVRSAKRAVGEAGRAAATVVESMDALPLSEVARRLEISPATLRRWARDGVVATDAGRWTPAAVAQARVVARLRARGHGLQAIRAAAAEGRLAHAPIEDLIAPAGERRHSLRAAARTTGLEPALIRRLWRALGFNEDRLEALDEEDIALLEDVGAVLEAGYPLVALLQLLRVYGSSLSRVADAEVRLFHLYVHEPLIRDGVGAEAIAAQMDALARELVPLSAPMLDRIHAKVLRHYIEQDVVGHLEREPDEASAELGRVRVAIGFADLTGYTRLTEDLGEVEAVDLVERFLSAVAQTLPEDARVIKTIGDAAMVVGGDPGALVDWAVGFQLLHPERPRPRIGLHAGGALFRDGDYYGSAVNLAARVGARAAGGEVLVTRAVVEAAGRHLAFERVGEVTMKGFNEATELFLAHQAQEAER
jgi:adenylate cyclase